MMINPGGGFGTKVGNQARFDQAGPRRFSEDGEAGQGASLVGGSKFDAGVVDSHRTSKQGAEATLTEWF